MRVLFCDARRIIALSSCNGEIISEYEVKTIQMTKEGKRLIDDFKVKSL